MRIGYVNTRFSDHIHSLLLPDPPHPFPQFHILFVLLVCFCNTLGPVCAAHKLTGVGLFPGAWLTYQGPQQSPQQPSIVKTSSARGGGLGASPHSGMLTGLNLCRQLQLLQVLQVHERCGAAMSRRHTSILALLDLWFLLSF